MKKRLAISLIGFCSALLAGVPATEYYLAKRWVDSYLLHPLDCPSVQVHQTDDFRVEFHRNSLCFRGPEQSLSEPFDVVLLGDSFLFGNGVADPEIISSLLRSKGFLTLNASEPATGPIEYLRRLRELKHRGLRMRNLVVGFFIGNDFHSLSRPSNLHEILRHQPGERANFRVFEAIKGLWYSWFYPYDLFIRDYRYQRDFKPDFLEWIYNIGPEAAERNRHQRYQQVTSEAKYFLNAEIYGKALTNAVEVMKAIASEYSDISRTVLIIPDQHYIKGELGHSYQEKRASFIEGLSANFKVIDLHDQLTDDSYLLNDGHFSKKGHQKVAEILFASLTN